ncbi:hypothetical protein XIS1_1190045 [Xenorhabdus innexi]|uniref:Uncharacterized protein n=1 Tax=Xenorhabdus innexi TaxID=290109 RepID=A0A1N6MRU5_9GAMM|nr:hypothetical protein Xinn_00265 [Xenorhabdus innexi]SIP71566.1 hypothetical protein XIS1_1190045 [Xenorhabdus innexi]
MGGVRKSVTNVTKSKYSYILLIINKNIETQKRYKSITLPLRVTLLKGYKSKI